MYFTKIILRNDLNVGFFGFSGLLGVFKSHGSDKRRNKGYIEVNWHQNKSIKLLRGQ